MSQCEAKTRAGRRCHNSARTGKRFCHVHDGTIDWKGVVVGAATVAGAAGGHIVLPGSGTVVGSFLGRIVGEKISEGETMKKRVFVSFDFDNDKKLKDFVIGQSKLPDSPFNVADHSLKEAAPEKDWEKKADAAIARSDIVLVMVGPKTHKAHGVLKEVKMARARDKKIVQVIGYRNGNYSRVPDAGMLYRWNWDNLKKLLG